MPLRGAVCVLGSFNVKPYGSHGDRLARHYQRGEVQYRQGAAGDCIRAGVSHLAGRVRHDVESPRHAERR